MQYHFLYTVGALFEMKLTNIKFRIPLGYSRIGIRAIPHRARSLIIKLMISHTEGIFAVILDPRGGRNGRIEKIQHRI